MRLRARVIFTTLLMAFMVLCSHAQSHKYRVWFTDKDTSTYSVAHPESYLSDACIARRNRQGIDVDNRDIPVNKKYLQQLETMGSDIVVTSRWMNTAVIAIDDTTIMEKIAALPHVDRIECVWKSTSTYAPMQRNKFRSEYSNDINDNTSSYGATLEQTRLLNLDSLHALGYRGNGMTIAVVDAGFYGVDVSSHIDNDKIVSCHDFSHGTMDYKQERHGTEVLSCMAGNVPGMYMGTAPDARYMLIVTEDVDSEYPIEEDYWAAGVELADSAGVDIINTSLAYTTFDDPSMNYTLSQLDGNTAYITRVAGIAADKGLLVVVAAGNEYNKAWQKIAFPADAHGVVTVGSVDADGKHSFFSSCGYTTDGRVKPDVMAMGSNAGVITADDIIKHTSGTSYAAPIMCGALACLWQSHPEWSVQQLIAQVHMSASHYNQPDALYGYGIPDVYAAYCNRSNALYTEWRKEPIYIKDKRLHLPATSQRQHVHLYNLVGQCIEQYHLTEGEQCVDLTTLNEGIYIVSVSSNRHCITQKIIVTQ